MSSDEVRDEELRRLATEVITELRESLRAANAESVTRGQQLMEDWVGDRPTHRWSAHDIWARLENDPGVFVQGDYALLRTGLGRRVSPDGPPIDMGLHFHITDDGLRVRGRQLARSVGLVVRWKEESGHQRETVIPHTLGDASQLIPYDEEFADSPLRVISFDASSVTGFGVWEPLYADSTQTSE